MSRLLMLPRILTLALVTAALALVACADDEPAPAASTAPPATPPANMPALSGALYSPDSKLLFDFEGAGAAKWSVENDGVMGGRSQGYARVAEGTLLFAGEVVTEGGGFSSARAPLGEDLSGYDGIELHVRGGGRTFELDVDDGTRSRGREVNRRGPVPTSDSWEVVRVPFASLEASAHGEPVEIDPINLSAVESLGVYIIDGQDGPFRLEVEWIRAYRQAE